MCFVSCKAQYTYKAVLSLVLRYMVTDMTIEQMCVQDEPLELIFLSLCAKCRKPRGKSWGGGIWKGDHRKGG